MIEVGNGIVSAVEAILEEADGESAVEGKSILVITNGGAMVDKHSMAQLKEMVNPIREIGIDFIVM